MERGKEKERRKCGKREFVSVWDDSNGKEWRKKVGLGSGYCLFMCGRLVKGCRMR